MFWSIREFPDAVPMAAAPRKETEHAAKNAMAAAVSAAQVIAADARNAMILSAVVSFPLWALKVAPVKQVRTRAGTAMTSSSTPSPGAATRAPRQTAESVTIKSSVSSENWSGPAAGGAGKPRPAAARRSRHRWPNRGGRANTARRRLPTPRRIRGSGGFALWKSS